MFIYILCCQLYARRRWRRCA